MQTTLPTKAESQPPRPVPPAPPAPPSDDRTFDLVAFGVVVAVLALILATVGIIFVGDDDTPADTTGAAGSAVATVELSEFAITPAALTMPAGGSLEVTNAGSASHNLTVSDTDLATADLGAGESETLDLSSLEPGEYEVMCSIPGHGDAGMKGTLTVTEGSDGSGLSAAGAWETSDSTAATHSGHGMTADDYEDMTQAMNDTIAAYPAETEGVGNQLLEPTVRAGGVKEFELTAEVTPWEVEPGTIVDAWTYNGTVPGPQIRVDVGDQVRIVLHNELPMGTDLHLHGIDVANDMDGGGLARAVMGSVAEALLRTLGRPVLVVGPHVAEDPTLAGRIVACVDGSDESERALEPAQRWAATLGLPLWLIEVRDPGADV